MGCQATINTTQIGDEILYIVIILFDLWQWLCLIGSHIMPPVPGFQEVGDINSREAIVFTVRISAKTIIE
jgi:hypothetical protein